MLKKLILLSCLFAGEFIAAQDGFKKRFDDWMSSLNHGQQTVLSVAATGVILGVAFGVPYLIKREPNQKKIEESQHVWQLFSGLVPVLSAVNTPQDLQKFILILHIERTSMAHFKVQVQASHDMLQARYDTPLKPWNWGEAMKQAYTQMQQVKEVVSVFDIMNTYQSFIVESDKRSTQDLMLHFANPNVLHPWHATAQQMEQDIAKIACVRHEYFTFYGLLRKALSESLQKIRTSDDFMQEKRAMYAQQQQERKIQAQETQAMAARKQANAQVQRNEIEREKLKIEQEKLRLEKEKHQQELARAAVQGAALGHETR